MGYIFLGTPKHDPNCVDVAARKSAATTLRKFMSGQITNDKFEVTMPITSDPSIGAAWESAWLYYSDMQRHKLIGNHRRHPDARKQWSRWILFLDSNLPYQWPEIAEHHNDPHKGPQTGFIQMLRRAFGRKTLTTGQRSQINRAQFAVWPFFSQRDYRQALQHPKRLSFRPAA